MRFSSKLDKLPPYLFAEIDKAKRQAKAEGRDIIDLGIGDPDLPTPDFIISALCEAVKDPANHRYAMDQGLPELRQEIAKWYLRKFGVQLDPETEILPLIGSKEGIAHLPFAVNEPGEVNLVPDPCYPPYRNASVLAGASVYAMGLREENGFLPELDSIPKDVLNKAKIVYLNYPNNPTSAVADYEFFRKVLDFAEKYDLIVVQDMAYSEIVYDGYKAVSILEVDKDKRRSVEFHSLSKTYNMTGWRIGWVCGNKDVIRALAKLKSNIDSGIFQAIQIAGITALRDGDSHIKEMQAIYKRRRDVLVEGLKALGFDVKPPKATFYVWMRINGSSIEFAKQALERADIVCTPGVGFGSHGEGYVRFALTLGEDRLKVALERLKKIV